MDLKETDILGSGIESHWYYTAKANAALRTLGEFAPKKILDVGAGSGFFARYLLERTKASEAWCIDTSYPAERSEMVQGKRIYFRRSIDAIDADLVLMMDVLEHVDNDVTMLQEYVAKVPTGSTFLITVPAFSFLWSAHDEYLEHKRRYTLRQLEETVTASGLEIRRSVYYFGAIFPIAATLRLSDRLLKRRTPARSQLKKHSLLVNAALKTLCALELPLMPLNRLAGLSVFCLATRPHPAKSAGIKTRSEKY